VDGVGMGKNILSITLYRKTVTEDGNLQPEIESNEYSSSKKLLE